MDIHVPSFDWEFDDAVHAEDGEAAGHGDDDAGRHHQEQDDLDPDVLQDDQEVDQETRQEDNKRRVKHQPGEHLKEK